MSDADRKACEYIAELIYGVRICSSVRARFASGSRQIGVGWSAGFNR